MTSFVQRKPLYRLYNLKENVILSLHVTPLETLSKLWQTFVVENVKHFRCVIYIQF